jgi:hypothetical protein
MKKLIFSVFFLGLYLMGYSANNDKVVEQLLKQFQSTDWPTVSKAKENLENLEASSIPYLINMLNDFSLRKLQNTGDLIYPGAEKFFGHGQIIDYDIDELCVRAGWLLEDLTFQNFGFIGIHLQDNELMDFIKFAFAEYYNNSTNRHQLEKMSTSERRKLIRSLSIKRAQDWWKTSSDGWNRLDALAKALGSTDEKRQVKALFYLRNGKTKCTGLTKSVYETRLENFVIDLSKADLKRVSENAKLIILDSECSWLSLKPAD